MDLVVGRGAYKRDQGKFPPWRQVNMLLEQTPVDPQRYQLLSRPPLLSYFTWGSGPVHGVFQRPGVLGGSLFAVIGSTLYKDGTSLGVINGTGPVSWAARNAELVATRGQTAYSYTVADGLDPIAFPDGANVRAVDFAAGWFIYVRSGSDRWYFSALNDGRTIDPLDYATAESEPDELYDVKIVGDTMYLAGSNTIEPWMLTGDSNLPYMRQSQRAIAKGVQATGCMEEMDNTVYFISGDGKVGRIGVVAEWVSDNSLEEKIRTSTSGNTFQFSYEGHLVLCVRIDSGTFGLDLSLPGSPWIELSTYGRDNWAPKCAVNVGSEPLFGDDTSNIIWRFGDFGTTDCGASAMPRIFSAGAPLNAQPQAVFNVLVDGNSGATEATSGEAADPLIEMRFSNTYGRTFSEWRASRFGAMGEYRRIARFGGCGMFDPPGFLSEFRMMAVAPMRVDSVRINESLAGRGR